MKKPTHKTMTLICIVLLMSSCSLFNKTTQTPQAETLNSPAFDYTPEKNPLDKSNNIKIALVNPKFAETFYSYNADPYDKFSKNMATDFVEILNARGYTYIGPLATYDEMVYNDKKTTDLVLETTIEMNIVPLQLITKKGGTSLVTGEVTYRYYLGGTSTITGKVNMSLSEPFTKTKVWTKSVQIEPTSFAYKSKEYYGKNIPQTDPGVYNPVSAALDKIYMNTLKMVYNHLDPQELAVKKEEALEIKNNSGFIKK